MRHFISPLLLSTVFAASAHAESPHIIINALRSPTPITQMASSVTVIDEQEIQRKNKPTMVELLRDVPGIALGNNGGVGQTTSLFMRGTNSNHVLVMMDGVRLNDPTNPADSFDFSNLTTDDIVNALRCATIRNMH